MDRSPREHFMAVGCLCLCPLLVRRFNIVHKLDVSQTADSVMKKNTNWISKGKFELVKITFSPDKQNQVLGLCNRGSGRPVVTGFAWSLRLQLPQGEQESDM